MKARPLVRRCPLRCPPRRFTAVERLRAAVNTALRHQRHRGATWPVAELRLCAAVHRRSPHHAPTSPLRPRHPPQLRPLSRYSTPSITSCGTAFVPAPPPSQPFLAHPELRQLKLAMFQPRVATLMLAYMAIATMGEAANASHEETPAVAVPKACLWHNSLSMMLENQLLSSESGEP